MAIGYGTRVTGLATLPFLMTMSLSAFAQPWTGMSMYDRRAEVTLNGTIVELREMAGMGETMPGAGMHVMLKTDKDTFEVHLGPVSYLKEQKVELANGDTIGVTGARVTMGDRKVILVRELRKGNQSWFLRDADGHPRWRMAPS